MVALALISRNDGRNGFSWNPSCCIFEHLDAISAGRWNCKCGSWIIGDEFLFLKLLMPPASMLWIFEKSTFLVERESPADVLDEMRGLVVANAGRNRLLIIVIIVSPCFPILRSAQVLISDILLNFCAFPFFPAPPQDLFVNNEELKDNNCRDRIEMPLDIMTVTDGYLVAVGELASLCRQRFSVSLRIYRHDTTTNPTLEDRIKMAANANRSKMLLLFKSCVIFW